MADSLRARQGVHNLSDAEVSAFRDAYGQMQAITDNRGFAYFAGLHGVPNWLCQHSTEKAPAYLFLPWHRAYLYNFELAMRSRVASVSLPWWDWTLRPPRQAAIPQAFADKTANGKPNPLYSFRIDLAKPRVHHTTTRKPGSVDDLPTQRTSPTFPRPATGANSRSRSKTSCTMRFTAGSAATWALLRSPPSIRYSTRIIA